MQDRNRQNALYRSEVARPLPTYEASTKKFLNYHKWQRYDGQRVGQRFVNMFIKNPWPELFYQINPDEAARIINQWLIDHHYVDDLPTHVSITGSLFLPTRVRTLFRK